MGVQWEFFAKPNPELAANSLIRKNLAHPIARLICSDSLFDGQWEVRAPPQGPFTLKVDGWSLNEIRSGVVIVIPRSVTNIRVLYASRCGLAPTRPQLRTCTASSLACPIPDDEVTCLGHCRAVINERHHCAMTMGFVVVLSLNGTRPAVVVPCHDQCPKFLASSAAVSMTRIALA